MTDNEYIAPVKDDNLTVKDVFDRIAEFQKQMSESSFHSLHRLGEAISSMGEDEDIEDKAELVEHISSIVSNWISNGESVVVMTLGAGDIDRLVNDIKQNLNMYE